MRPAIRAVAARMATLPWWRAAPAPRHRVATARAPLGDPRSPRRAAGNGSRTTGGYCPDC
eukprot:2790631-Prymnesium_polylepis.1